MANKSEAARQSSAKKKASPARLGPMTTYAVALIREAGKGRSPELVERAATDAASLLGQIELRFHDAPSAGEIERQQRSFVDLLSVQLATLVGEDLAKSLILKQLTAGKLDAFLSEGAKEKLLEYVRPANPAQVKAQLLALKARVAKGAAEQAAAAEEISGIEPGSSAKPEGMQISEEQKKAAKGAAYLPPSRVGKRALAGHFSEETLSEFTLLAAIQSRTKQSLLDEALELLFEKHGADLAAVRRARRDRQP